MSRALSVRTGSLFATQEVGMCTPTKSSVEELALSQMRKWSPSDVNAATVSELDTLPLAEFLSAYLVDFEEDKIQLFTELRDILKSLLMSTTEVGITVTDGTHGGMVSFLAAVDSAIYTVAPGGTGIKTRITWEKRARALIDELWKEPRPSR